MTRRPPTSPKRRALELEGHGSHWSGETSTPRPDYHARHRAIEVVNLGNNFRDGFTTIIRGEPDYIIHEGEWIDDDI